MATQQMLVKHNYGLRDVAVDGLWKGALAGAAMAGYLMMVTAVLGENPLAVLSRFTSEGVDVTPLVGAISHLAVSGIYGAMFTVLWHRIGRHSKSGPLALVGALVFSGLLFVIAELILLPSVQSPLLAVPALHFGIGHVVYGLVLGGLIARSQKD